MISKLAVVLILCLAGVDAATPLFLQAISSALSTVPFSGFPVTAGLAGAKLALGGKMLYYLGRFGRGGSEPAKPVGGLPPLNMMGTGGFTGFGPQQGLTGQKPINPGIIMQALASQGINPLQLLRALEGAGINPAQLFQAMEVADLNPLSLGQSSAFSNQAGGSFFDSRLAGAPFGNFPPAFEGRIPNMGQLGGLGSMAGSMGGRPFSGFGAGAGNGVGAATPSFPPQQTAQQSMIPQDFSDTMPPRPEVPEELDAEEDIESFFAFLKDTDDNKCISRLICDIGRDPKFLGEFTENIATIISSLDVSPESGAYAYVEIMEAGRKGADCGRNFPECTDDAYEIVKSVAPSVGVPPGINSDAVNQL